MIRHTIEYGYPVMPEMEFDGVFGMLKRGMEMDGNVFSFDNVGKYIYDPSQSRIIFLRCNTCVNYITDSIGEAFWHQFHNGHSDWIIKSITIKDDTAVIE